MSHLSPEELARLEELSYWVRELFSERGHNIGSALDQDPCFRDGERGRSGLARMMMQAAVSGATSRMDSLSLMTGEGGVRLVQSIDRGHDRRYRVLSAKKQPDDSFRILSSSDKILQVDHNSLFTEEPWVLAYTLDADNQVDDLFAAQVLDRLDGDPGELVLGPEYLLAGRPPTGGGFQPTDEDLPGYDDEGEEGVADAG